VGLGEVALGPDSALTAPCAFSRRRRSSHDSSESTRLSLGLPAEGVTFRIRTQKLIGVGGRSTDLEIVAWQGAKPLVRLWFENKLDSTERERQLDDQYDALQIAQPAAAASRLFAIVKADSQREEIEMHSRVSNVFSADVLTWLEVRDLVRKVGRQAAGSEWPRRPGKPDTAESWGVLCELLWEIGNQSASPVLGSEPVTQDDLNALAHINRTIERLKSLLWQVFDSPEMHPYGRKSFSDPKWPNPNYYGFVVQADISAPTVSCWIEDDEVGWMRYAAISAGSGNDSPALLEVGVWTPDVIDAGAENTQAWRDRLEVADFHLDVPKASNPNEPKAVVWLEEPLFEDLQPELIAQRDHVAALIRDALQSLERDGLAPKPRKPSGCG
jgi:hypothetical protein